MDLSLKHVLLNRQPDPFGRGHRQRSSTRYHMPEISIEQHGTLWLAHVPTAYGYIELLCGEGASPDEDVMDLISLFLNGSADHIATVRKSVFKFPMLWRPIRFAVNNEGRLGLQFKNRLTGRQDGMYFADEHSSFQNKLKQSTDSRRTPPR